MGKKIATGRSDPKLKIAKIAAFDAVLPRAPPKPYGMNFFFRAVIRFPPKFSHGQIFINRPRSSSHSPFSLSFFFLSDKSPLFLLSSFPLFLFRSLVIFIPSTVFRLLQSSLDYK